MLNPGTKDWIASSVSIAALLIASWMLLNAGNKASAESPNIVLIFADDLGINDLGCYGRMEHDTPNLDRLASDGMRFANAYTAQPICSPSRAALMTGKCPARLNLTNFLPGRPDATSQKLLQPRIEGQLPLEEVTIAEVLKRAGYKTGMFGKWHLGGPQFGPEKQGFDVVEMPPANTDPSLGKGGKGEFLISDAAESFIEAHHTEPFFCYVAHHNPHIPLAADAEMTEQYRSAYHPTYAAMIHTLDQSVGRLMDKVKSLGLEQRTIFIFTSDNGGLHVLESLGTPATHNTPHRAGKGFLYEGGIREPLIVRWPAVIEPGTLCESPVVLTDLVPTLIAASGIDVAKQVGPLDGVDITQLLRGESMPPRSLYWHFPHYSNQGGRPAGAIHVGDWKLIEHFEDQSAELFDLSRDPSEANNLASAQPERVDSMRAELAAWRGRVGARMPLSNLDFNETLHRRIYLDLDSSAMKPRASAIETGADWGSWRSMMNAAAKGRRPSTFAPEGDIRLLAKDAEVHGKNLRYESDPQKDVLGFWTIASDWASWRFVVQTPGDYEVEVQQGCGTGSGGADVRIEIGAESLSFVVEETGHFQHMITRTIGQVRLNAGEQVIAAKPQSKPGVAVMDLRRIVLRPID